MAISLFTILALDGALQTIFIAGDFSANNTNHKGWGDPVAGIKAWFGLTESRFLNRG